MADAPQKNTPVNPAAPMRLDGKVALVTGAASGIGKEIALAFAGAGAAVAIADMNADGIKTTVDEFTQKGFKAMGVNMDVTSEDQVNAGIDKCVKDLGSIDVLVSNAGIQIVHPIEEFPYADWKKMIAIHLDGAFLTTKAAIKYMYQSGKRGAIIYTGSVHSKEGSPLKSAYVAAKHGLIGLAEVGAKEGAKHNVSFNVVCPGFVRTPLVDKQIPEQAKALGISEDDVVKKIMLKDTFDGEFTTVEDVAHTCLFFATFPSLAISGQSMVVSHGWFMQ